MRSGRGRGDDDKSMQLPEEARLNPDHPDFVPNIHWVKHEFKKVFLLEDDSIIDVACAAVLSAYTKGDPIWLLIVGPSSGGKSEIVTAFSQVKFVHEVSELTENTLLSGMNNAGGTETSLLTKIGTVGCIAMKDFTSVISMRMEKREIILSQLRHVYDGNIEKKTGNGKNPSWTGKVSFLGGVTEAIYGVEDNSASMGRRNIHYVMPDQDRRETTRAARKNRMAGDIREKRLHLQWVFKTYIEHMVNEMPPVFPEVEEGLSEKIIAISDFSTHARTPTERNYRSELRLVISKEMPMRMSEQLHLFAQIFAYMYGQDILPEQQRNTIFKIAMDSIPKQKRIALKVVATFNSVTTRGVAMYLNYPTETARIWLEDLNVLEIIVRNPTKSKGKGGIDYWDIKDEFRDVMIEYDKIERIHEDLVVEDDRAAKEDVDPGLMIEQGRRADDDWADLKQEFGGQEKLL